MLEKIEKEIEKQKTILSETRRNITNDKQKLEELKEDHTKIVELLYTEKKKLISLHLKLSSLFLPYLILIVETNKVIQLILLIFTVFHIFIHLSLIRRTHKIVNSKFEVDIVTESMIYSFIQIVIIFGLLIYISDIFIKVNLYNINDMSIFDAIYFSIITITTVGYGDIHPIHWYSKLVIIAEITIGVWFLITLIPIMISLKKENAMHLSNIEYKIDLVDSDIVKNEAEGKRLEDSIDIMEKTIEEIKEKIEK